MTYTVTIRCTATGECRNHVERCDWNDTELFDWEENNRACDCTRAELFARVAGEHDPNIRCGETAYTIPAITLQDGTVVYEETDDATAAEPDATSATEPQGSADGPTGP